MQPLFSGRACKHLTEGSQGGAPAAKCVLSCYTQLTDTYEEAYPGDTASSSLCE